VQRERRKGAGLDSRRALAKRLRKVRIEVFGEDGVEDLASQLGIPPETWRHYEAGVTLPAEVLLAFIELAGVELTWLSAGVGIRFRPKRNHDPFFPN
jgi:hypothetical protein